MLKKTYGGGAEGLKNNIRPRVGDGAQPNGGIYYILSHIFTVLLSKMSSI